MSGALGAPSIEFKSTLTTAEEFGDTLTTLTKGGWQPSGPMYQERMEDGTYRYVIVSVRQVNPEPSPIIAPLKPGELQLVNLN